MKRNIRLITSLACGLLAVMLGYLYGESARAEVRAERSEVLERYGGEVTNLVVARVGMTSGSVVSENNVEVREWLADLAPTGAITSLDDVVGVRLTSDVAAGEVLNEVDIAAADGVLEVPSGRVAVSVRLSEKTGLTTAVAKGARVVAYRAVEDGLKLLTANATVLSVSNSSEYSSAQSLCLALLPSNVEGVLAASSDGSLRLALPSDGVMDQVGSTGEAETGEGAAGAEVPDAADGASGADDADDSAEATTAEAENKETANE